MDKKQKINDLLTRGVVDVVDMTSLQKRLLGTKKLRIKLGIDPTSPNIHLGRAITLWKLREFQELGHTVVFIVGDFTALIGDTSDKDSERPMLTEAQVKNNLQTYFKQASKILLPDKLEKYYNSKWLKKLGFTEIAEMANSFGLHDFASRENIKKRLDAGKRVSVRELLYPLMQGYDSVAVKADVEVGGSDQRYNLLAGREIQRLHKQIPQDIITFELLEGLDGRKMSSSWGNTVNVNDEPKDMFGKLMTLDDSLMPRYFKLATRMSETEVQGVYAKWQNPRDVKIVLAQKIVEMYHGKLASELAKTAFIQQFSQKLVPTDLPIKKLKAGSYNTIELLVLLELAVSKSEARRLIEQKGVKVNSEVYTAKDLTLSKTSPLTVQVGKRKFIKLVS